MSTRAFAFVLVVCLTLVPSPSRSQNSRELRWGGDAEGGAPYVEADATEPTRVVGFDVDIAQLLASGLGRTPRFVQVGFTSIDAAASRGDDDNCLCLAQSCKMFHAGVARRYRIR